MIDFRYHLVSIVSIFLALAVGIVLGAGPLKEDLGQGLNTQLSALRKEKNDLRTELDAANKGLDSRNAFASAVTPTLVSGRLSGRTVALVVVPGADNGLVKTTQATLVAAGAKIGAIVTLTDAWADPARLAFRTDLATQLAGPLKIPSTVTTDLLPGAVLGHTLLTKGQRSGERLSSASTQALESMRTAGLLSASPEAPDASSSVVVVSGPATTPLDAAAAARLKVYVHTVSALDGVGSGAVVAGPTNDLSATTASGLVAAVRGDADARKVAATVDDADLAMGQAAVVLALEQQYAGGNGQYGLANDATSPVPELTAK